MELNTPIEQTPKVGRFYAKRLKKLKISTLEDLLHHYPFRYGDLGKRRKISQLVVGEVASASGQVWQIKNIRTRYGKKLTLATVNDGTGSIEIVWFNQPFLTNVIKQGARIGLAGKVGIFSHKPTFVNPEYENFSSKTGKGLHTQGFVPVYPETSGISSKFLRTRVKELLPVVLSKIKEPLPTESLKRNTIIPKSKAIWQIHFPTSSKQITTARKRLAFDELLIAHLRAYERKNAWQKNLKSIKLKVHQEKILSLISSLPFNLTPSQNSVLKEILADQTYEKPMNRLLQGDVGSGKTVVAAIAAYNVFLNGYQSTLMAPTEILAEQHLNTLKSILSTLGVKISLRTARQKKNEPFDILVGTHALISRGTEFKDLAFVVIDEQHRFGVEQRALLREKGIVPHVLTMTATPIPRSLALTLYGDLDISSLGELPTGRKKVKTFVVPPEKRTRAYQFIGENVKKGRQAFIICPLIEPSETLVTAKAAKEEYERLKKGVFPDLSLGLLHGRMLAKDKNEVLDKFRQNKLDILVSTPVVEVGIDVPNAVVMMIEASERFGLASLHQLRGRVGRSEKQSFCLLFTESSSRNVIERLSALEKHHLGLQLAEIDLKLRGPGQMYGTAQSGSLNFKIASLADLPMIKAAKKEAESLFFNPGLKKLPLLRSEIEKMGLVPPD